MRSRTSSFNGALFKKTLIRFWPLWFAYAFVWVIAFPVNLGGSIARSLAYSSVYSDLLYDLQYIPLEAGSKIGAFICAIFACLAAMAVYSHLYTARHAGAYAALPVRREGVFLSVTLAGLLPMLVINIAVFLIALLTEAASGVMDVPFLLQWLALATMLTLAFFGLAAICAQFTGNLIVLPFVYIIFNFVACVVEYLIRTMLGVLIFGFSAGSMTFDVLSPIVSLLQTPIMSTSTYAETDIATVTGYYFAQWGLVAAYAAAGLLLLAGAFLLYRRRRMETAGDVVAVKCLKPVFKYCMAFGGALCLGTLLFSIIFSDFGYAGSPEYILSFTAFMLLGCLIGYFVAEMMITKTVSVFRGKKRWLGLGISCAVLVLTMLACKGNLFGYETRIPAASEISEVSLNAGDRTVLSEEGNIASVLALHSDIVAHKNWHGSTDEQRSGCSLTLTYTLRDGSILQRYYMLSYGGPGDPGDVRALQDLINVQEAIDFRKKTDFAITEQNITYASVSYGTLTENRECVYEGLNLTAEEANELYYTCILPDIADGTLGRIWLITDDSYLDTVYACSIQIECNARNTAGDYSYQYFYTTPTVDSFRTNAWLEAHGVALLTERECGTKPYDYTTKNYAVQFKSATTQAEAVD